MTETRKFATRLGFILTASAAAIGLGNIWRFPYLTAEYGGGTFVLFYLIFVVTFGFTLMLTETAIGRRTGKSSAEAFLSLCGKHKVLGTISGMFPVVIVFLVVSYYAIITGWTLKYAFLYLSGSGELLATENGSFFSTYICTSFEPILWTLVVFVLAAVILLFGIRKGLERVCVVLVPLLIICMAGLVVWVLTTPGGLDGIAYCFIPDFTKFSLDTVVAALGQVFFSLSLGYGIYITYGMYLSKKENIKTSIHTIEIFDTGAALLAMMVVIPIVFAFSGGSPEALGGGSALLFEQIPQALVGFPNSGRMIGFLFFIIVFFAALTSVFSMIEIPVSIMESKYAMSRKKAIALICSAIAILSVVVNFGFSIWKDFTICGKNIFDCIDLGTSNILIPISAILCCIIIGWIAGPKYIIEEIEASGQVFLRKKLYTAMIKFVVPVFIIVIMVSNIIYMFI